jgi:hypothetical protein
LVYFCLFWEFSARKGVESGKPGSKLLAVGGPDRV